MDWLKELLKKAGLDESKVDSLVGDVNKELPKHFVPKAQYNDQAEQRKKLESDLAERDKQLEGLKKSSGDSEALKQQIEALQGENKAAKEKYESEMKELSLSTAVKLALAGKVHDPDIVTGLLDKTKIELDDAGGIKGGLDDQIKALQTSKAFLFVPEKGEEKPQFRGTKPPEGSPEEKGGSGEDLIGAKLGKQSAVGNTNLEEARQSYFK